MIDDIPYCLWPQETTSSSRLTQLFWDNGVNMSDKDFELFMDVWLDERRKKK